MRSSVARATTMPPTHIAATACALACRCCFSSATLRSNHCRKHLFEGALRIVARAHHIRRQRHHRTRVLDVLKVLSREISLYHLRHSLRRSHIDLHALPPVLPLRVGEEASQNLRIKCALAAEVSIKPAMRQAPDMICCIETLSKPCRLNKRRALSMIVAFTTPR
jgi:hypothetical protein